LTAVSGTARASVITLDGRFDGAPPYSTNETVSWYNGHRPSPDSIYGGLDTTTIWYGAGTLAGDASGTEYFFLYVEVPLYAKNMIWEDRDWKGEFPILNTNPLVGLTEADVASYRVHHETHHNPGDMKLDFGGATGSEKLIFNDSNGTDKFKANLAGDADNTFGLFGFMDSVDYLLDNSISTEKLSLARDTTMSFEFQFALDSATNAELLGYVRNGIEFHLSPERGLLVPEPGSITLFAGLFGLASCCLLYKRSSNRCSRGTKLVCV
jgi:hypothetical protein